MDYSNISQILQEQKEALIAKINSIINKRVYPGLKFESEDDSYDFDQIPGLKEAGWTQQAYEQVRYRYSDLISCIEKAKTRVSSSSAATS